MGDTPGTGAVVRTPFATPATYDEETGYVTATFHASPSFLYFHNNELLKDLLGYPNVGPLLESKVSFEIDAVFADPAQAGMNLNIMVANTRQNDNWNATSVRDLTIGQINGTEPFYISDGILGDNLHDVAATNANFTGNWGNRWWVLIRGGRNWSIEDQGTVTVTIRSIKVFLEQ